MKRRDDRCNIKSDSKIYYIFDYIWFIGEELKRKYGSPSSGDTLLLFTWMFVFLIPLIMPLMYQLLGNPATMILGLSLVFLPSIFCKLRYTELRRKVILAHYSGIKNIFTRWFILFAAIIVLAILNFMLMYHLAFITDR